MRAYLLLVLMTAGATFMRYGVSARSFGVWVVTSGLVAIPCYLSSRGGSLASPAKRRLAIVWLNTRRILSFAIVVILIYAALATLVGETTPESWARAIIWLLVACFFIRFGVYGAASDSDNS